MRSGTARPEVAQRKTIMTEQRIDQFFLMHSARADTWRAVMTAAEGWAAGQKDRAAVETALKDLVVLEEFHAYPGPRLMKTLKDRIAANDAGGTARLVRRISDAILTRSYAREDGAINSAGDNDADEVPDFLPSVFGQGEKRRPYFEVLFVSPQQAGRRMALCDEIRRVRRPEDSFVYEPIIVGSFEDAFCAAIVNPQIAAVVVAEGVPYRSLHDAPVLRSVLDPLFAQSTSGGTGLQLADALKHIRPELDVYLTSDRDVEKIAGSEEAASVRRVFYGVEEPLELHLSILEGIQARYSTPFFDNLKNYTKRPIGTFHALPIARGKSVFRSDWIRDMGEFYGINLFLAESSATTGGLDSMLEPTGTIKKAQEDAARAFGADQVFFVTNGTSTSNKMVVQALVAPGDIVIVDRNCHKSHHYGMVLGGGQPLYVEAFPLTQFSMYGAVPLSTIKKALLDLRAEGRLDRVRMLDLTNCTFDGHMYNTRRSSTRSTAATS
jgi:arginine decarboxylase